LTIPDYLDALVRSLIRETLAKGCLPLRESKREREREREREERYLKNITFPEEPCGMNSSRFTGEMRRNMSIKVSRLDFLDGGAASRKRDNDFHG